MSGTVWVWKPEGASNYIIRMFFVWVGALRSEQNLGAGLNIVEKPLVVDDCRLLLRPRRTVRVCHGGCHSEAEATTFVDRSFYPEIATVGMQ